MQKELGMGRAAAGALLALAFFGISVARATTPASMDVRELTRQATYVARVRCVNVLSTMEMGMVWTLNTFEVTESWKGEPPPRFTVRLPGGEAGGQRMTVEGAPRFTEGEEAVLFVTEDRGRQMNIVGWAQGTFRIRKSRRTGIEKAIQDTATGQAASVRTGASAEDERKRIPLATLRGMVEQAKQ